MIIILPVKSLSTLIYGQVLRLPHSTLLTLLPSSFIPELMLFSVKACFLLFFFFFLFFFVESTILIIKYVKVPLEVAELLCVVFSVCSQVPRC